MAKEIEDRKNQGIVTDIKNAYNKMYGAYTPLEKCSVTDVPSIGNGKMHTQFTAQDLSDITFNKTSYRFYHNKKLCDSI